MKKNNYKIIGEWKSPDVDNQISIKIEASEKLIKKDVPKLICLVTGAWALSGAVGNIDLIRHGVVLSPVDATLSILLPACFGFVTNTLGFYSISIVYNKYWKYKFKKELKNAEKRKEMLKEQQI